MVLADYLLPYIGVKEIPGVKENPIIINWIKNIVKSFKGKEEEISWCSIVLMNILKPNYNITNANISARSWLNVGEKIKTPIENDCIVVLWREKRTSWKGHVGIYVKHDANYVYILGGNQGDKVCIQRYPLYRVLNYIKLSKI